jgi:hypothetical protein
VGRIVDKLIRDKHNNVVLGQSPNFPIIAWFVFFVAAHIVQVGVLQKGFAELSGAFLFAWSYLEIVQGVNYFRRSIGVMVLFGILVSYFY